MKAEGTICNGCGSTIKYIGSGMWIDRLQSEMCPTTETLHTPISIKPPLEDDATIEEAEQEESKEVQEICGYYR